MKNSKYYKKHKRCKVDQKRIGIILNKLLLAVIVMLISMILCNYSSSFRDKYFKYCLEDNISFTKIRKIYDKVKGKKSNETILVSSEISNISDDKIKSEDNYTEIDYGVNEPVKFYKSGIIVFVGEKENLGETVIVQGNDGVDIWYSHVKLEDKSLYDYVKANEELGSSTDGKLLLTIMKKGKYLTYEEYFKD